MAQEQTCDPILGDEQCVKVVMVCLCDGVYHVMVCLCDGMYRVMVCLCDGMYRVNHSVVGDCMPFVNNYSRRFNT